MAVESVTYINDLDDSLPPRTDPRKEGADHLRNVKKAIKGTFPNISEQVLVNAVSLNQIVHKGRTRSFFMGQL